MKASLNVHWLTDWTKQLCSSQMNVTQFILLSDFCYPWHVWRLNIDIHTHFGSSVTDYHVASLCNI